MARDECSTRRRRSTRSSAGTSATRRSQPAPQVQDLDLLAGRHAVRGERHRVPRRGAPGARARFDVWVGGGLSTNPMLAKRLGVWVPLNEVPDVWAGVVGIFRDYGYRRLRNRARLKFLVADWGVERFREVLEKEYLGRTLLDGPAANLPAKPVDHIGVHRQSDGANYVGAARWWAGCPAPSWRSSPTWSRRTAATGCGSPVPEAARAGRGAGADRLACHGAARDRPGGPAVGLAARHDGLHRHRVLQARHRRDQAARRGAGRAPGGAAARLRRGHLHPPQRLPERLRPHPGRRHRAQGQLVVGPDGRQVEASRCTSAAASAWRRGRPPASAASCAV
ncbi:hypothetical protein V2I01_07395 [Micromonospora sp. BRA006-A]|nr:hypothetical protein [Micromonospora sp. BRA006-A]